jgi:hypothetical protein
VSEYTYSGDYYAGGHREGVEPYGWTPTDQVTGPYGGTPAWNWTDEKDVDERYCAEETCRGYHTKKSIYCKGHERKYLPELGKVTEDDEQA